MQIITLRNTSAATASVSPKSINNNIPQRKTKFSNYPPETQLVVQITFRNLKYSEASQIMF